MSADEQIEVNESTGAKKARNLVRSSLIPPQALLDIAKHYGVGSLKYEDNNWRRGYAWSWSYDSLIRHLAAFWDGEDYDACTCIPQATEPKCSTCGATGSKHIIAAAWHAIALATLMDEHPELDDRWSTIKEKHDEPPGDAAQGDRRGGSPAQDRPRWFSRPHRARIGGGRKSRLALRLRSVSHPAAGLQRGNDAGRPPPPLRP